MRSIPDIILPAELEPLAQWDERYQQTQNVAQTWNQLPVQLASKIRKGILRLSYTARAATLEQPWLHLYAEPVHTALNTMAFAHHPSCRLSTQQWFSGLYSYAQVVPPPCHNDIIITMTDSPSKYLAAFASTHELMLLQRRAADTLQRMQYALLQQHLTPLADLHGPDAQRRLKDLFREIHEKKPTDLLVFLQKLAGDGPFHRWNPAYPDPDWKLRTPGTELIRTLVNQTLLTLASLQENNKNVDSPSPDSL